MQLKRTQRHTCKYLQHLHIPTIPIHTYKYLLIVTYLQYLHIPTIPSDTVPIPAYTYAYLDILNDTCSYIMIPAHKCICPTPQTWNRHILATRAPFNTSQRTDLTTIRLRQIVLVCGTWSALATT